MATADMSMGSDHGFWLRRFAELGLRVLRRLREAQEAQAELRERVLLRQEPWREEFLHWSYDGGEWRLHGHRLAAPGARRRSVTRSGWCPRASQPQPMPDQTARVR